MKFFFTLLFLFFSVTAAADCEGRLSQRLSNRVDALIQILDGAVTKNVLKRRALEKLANDPDLTNPFPSADEHVLRAQYQEVFDNMTRDFSPEDVTRFRTALAAHLAGKAAVEAIGRQAFDVTREVFAPKVRSTLDFLPQFQKSQNTPEVVGTREGRPIFINFQVMGLTNYNDVYLTMFDPFNRDENQRMRRKRISVQFMIGIADASIGSTTIEHTEDSDYIVRWDTKRAMDLRTLEDVSFKDLTLGPSKEVRRAGGSDAEIDGTLYGGYLRSGDGGHFWNLDTGEKFPDVTAVSAWARMPKPLIFKSSGKLVASVPSGRGGLAVIDLETGAPRLVYKETRSVHWSEFSNAQLAYIAGNPWIYLREKPEGILMLNASKKEVRSFKLGDNDSNVSTVRFRGKDQLLWFERGEGTPYLLDPSQEEPMAAEPLGIHADSVYPFVYNGELYAFVVSYYSVRVVSILQTRP